MAGIVYDLIEVLEQQNMCYENLYTLATYKQQAVAHHQIELLTEVVEKEEAFIGRMNVLEKKREELLKDISIVTGLSYKELTITKLIDKMGHDLETSHKLKKVRKEILEWIEKIEAQNKLNKELIETAMEYVDFTVNAIKSTRLTTMPAGYSKPGQNQHIETQSLFDGKQ